MDSENVVSDGLSPTFDVDLTSFLSKAGTYASELSLDTLFTNLTDLLKEVASYGPDLDTGGSQTALNGLFDIVNEVSEFGDALGDFLDLIENGEFHLEGINHCTSSTFMPQVNLNLQNWVLFTFFTTVTALIPSGKSKRIVYYAVIHYIHTYLKCFLSSNRYP